MLVLEILMTTFKRTLAFLYICHLHYHLIMSVQDYQKIRVSTLKVDISWTFALVQV